METFETSEPDLNQIDNNLEWAMKEFRTQLSRKTPDTLKQRGSCLRLKHSALRIADLLVEATGQKKLPIDLDPICRRMQVHSVVNDSNLTAYVSELCPDSHGFTIRISSRETGIRGRTAIAHEIGHVLFFDTTKTPPVRLFSTVLRSPRIDKQEWISWDFARELLLPRTLVMGVQLQNRSPIARRIVEYAKKWEVSVEFLCHRIVRDLRFWENSAVFTFTENENQINPRAIKLYRGIAFPRFRLLGTAGFLTSSREFSNLVANLQKSEELDSCLDWAGSQMWIQLFKYSNVPSRVIGVLEIPAKCESGDNSR